MERKSASRRIDEVTQQKDLVHYLLVITFTLMELCQCFLKRIVEIKGKIKRVLEHTDHVNIKGEKSKKSTRINIF